MYRLWLSLDVNKGFGGARDGLTSWFQALSMLRLLCFVHAQRKSEATHAETPKARRKNRGTPCKNNEGG